MVTIIDYNKQVVDTLVEQITKAIRLELSKNNDYVNATINHWKIPGSQIQANSLPGTAIQDGSLSSLKVYDFVAQAASIAAAQIQNANIGVAQIENLDAYIANITHAVIESADMQWADISRLTAVVATIAAAQIGTADIDWANIKDLTTNTAIFSEGVGSKLYVARLAVTEANMVSLTVGDLVVKGSDGFFYSIIANEDGTVTTQKKEIEGKDMADATIPGGKMIENSITARELNVESLFADNAMLATIKSKHIDVTELFASDVFIQTLNAFDITANEKLQIYVKDAVDGLGSTISITKEKIEETVSNTYVKTDDVSEIKTNIKTNVEKTAEKLSIVNEKVETITSKADEAVSATRTIRQYMTFENGIMTIGQKDNPMQTQYSSDKVSFLMNGQEVAYLSNSKLHITQAEIVQRMQIGKFTFEPQTNGNMSLTFTG